MEILKDLIERGRLYQGMEGDGHSMRTEQHEENRQENRQQ